jgi:uncharacterized protein
LKAFVNRKSELSKLDLCRKNKAGLVVLYGRRRVGKTALLTKWISNQNVGYSQAIEAHTELQLQQLTEDIVSGFDIPVPPRNWSQFFKLLKSFPPPWTLCLDEFQYLVQSAQELPSQLQKFADHALPKGCMIILAGSSQSLMHSLVMDSTQPLFGRSDLLLNLKPMLYRDFCDALNNDPRQPNSILQYTLTGGLPRYWKFLDRMELRDPILTAEALYFESGSLLEDEPDRILKDEGSLGQMARSILECIGRGSHKLSEIAARLNQPATNLSRAMRMLVDLSLVLKDHPFGASERESKLSLYRLADPVLLFWYHVYSPLRTRWGHLPQRKKLDLLHAHGGMVLEQLVREHFHGSKRYWEKKFEWDVVREDGERSLVITEVKFGKITSKERSEIIRSITAQFSTSLLAVKYRLKGVEVMDLDDALALLT